MVTCFNHNEEQEENRIGKQNKGSVKEDQKIEEANSSHHDRMFNCVSAAKITMKHLNSKTKQDDKCMKNDC